MTKKFILLASLILLTISPISSCVAHKGEVLPENYWIVRKALPCPSWGEAAVVNGKIYFFTWNATYEYDPAADSWTAKTPMPTPRTSFALAVYNGRIYVIGGSPIGAESYYGMLHCGVNEVYDPTTDTWERKTDMPTKRGRLRAAVVEGKIHLIAGLEDPVSTGPNVSFLNEVYDPETDAWTTAEPIPIGVFGYACAVVDNKIYIMAGQGATGKNDHVLFQIYDPKTGTWSTGSPPPVMVVDAAAAATTGTRAPKRIYLIGGRINYSMDGSNIVQVYILENDSWIIGASMPTARYVPATTVINDTIYAIGGIEMFNLSPPFGWTTANEQYIPFGYNASGLNFSTPPVQEGETNQSDQRPKEKAHTLNCTALLVAATGTTALVITAAILLKKVKGRSKTTKNAQASQSAQAR